MKAKALKTEENAFNPTMLTDPQAIAEATAAMEARLEAARTALATRAMPANDDEVRAAKAKAKARRAAKALLRTADGHIGNEAVRDIVLPTIERVLNGDVQIVELPEQVAHAGAVKVLRSKGLHYRLTRLNLDDDLIAVALRFNKTFEAAKIGGLTANLDGFSGGAKRTSQPEKWALAMDELSRASRGPVSNPLTTDERAVLYGYVVYDVSMCDLGAYVARCVSPDEKMHKFTGKLSLHKALEKLLFFYEDWDYRNGQALDW